jgi:hypothetical protein
MVINRYGNEINDNQDEWKEWTDSQTVTLEFTRAELTAVVIALESHEGLLAESTKLHGKALQDACTD